MQIPYLFLLVEEKEFMRFYFHLQYVRFCRILREEGIHPAWVYLSVFLIFVLLSQLILAWSKVGSWLYIGLAILIFTRLKHGALVTQVFSKKSIYLLAFFETLVCAIPFIALLLSNQFYLESLLLVPLLFSVSFLKVPDIIMPKIPTPFYRRPFEFVVGFRKSFPLIIVFYAMVVISLLVLNLNLGLVSVLLIYLVIAGYYGNVEPAFLVWTYAFPPTHFLTFKAKTALLYSFLMVLPASLAMMVVFPSKWYLILAFYCFGVLLPIASLLNKYVSFPRKAEYINAIFIGSCMVFPPIFLFIIPYLSSKASENLKEYL